MTLKLSRYHFEKWFLKTNVVCDDIVMQMTTDMILRFMIYVFYENKRRFGFIYFMYVARIKFSVK